MPTKCYTGMLAIIDVLGRSVMIKWVEYLTLLGSQRWKTKFGYFVTTALLATVLVGGAISIHKLLKMDDKTFLIVLCVLLVVSQLSHFLAWYFYSGRMPIANSKFTVVFCLEGNDLKSDGRSDRYIQNAIAKAKGELDKLGILEKIKLNQIGKDIIRTKKEALNYRIKHNTDLIIWGNVLSGSKDEQDVCDFNKISFTYRGPSPEANANLAKLFKNDVNIALVKRDWHIYEINSSTDIGKISGHFSEIIMFILGVIYCLHHDYIEDSAKILECLFETLKRQTSGEKIKIDDKKSTIEMSASTLRKGHLLPILCAVYKELGFICERKGNHKKALFYLKKFVAYKTNDTAVLCSLALCSYLLGNLTEAKKYTDKIGKVDKYQPVYFFNKAFFCILDGKYRSMLSLYKKVIKGKGAIDSCIVTQVIGFLDQRKAENPKELAYDFAIGFLNYHLCDKKMGTGELKKFTKTAKKEIKYNEMVNYAKQLFYTP